MKRTVKILSWTFGGVVIAVLVMCGINFSNSQRNIRKAASDQKLFDYRLAQLRHDLPLGTPLEEVLSYLQAHGEDAAGLVNQDDEIDVHLGRLQATNWYCNYFEQYAKLSFATDTSTGLIRRRLANITTKSVGECL